jgi:hypothetical protein
MPTHICSPEFLTAPVEPEREHSFTKPANPPPSWPTGTNPPPSWPTGTLVCSECCEVQFPSDESIHVRFTSSRGVFRSEVVFRNRAVGQNPGAKIYICERCQESIHTSYEGNDTPAMIGCCGDYHEVVWCGGESCG